MALGFGGRSIGLHGGLVLGPGCLGLAGAAIAAALTLASCFALGYSLGTDLGAWRSGSGVGARIIDARNSGSILNDMAAKVGGVRFDGRGFCLLDRLGACA